WGVGAVVGLAILRVAGRGAAMQAIGIVSALVGILIGKYLSFAFTIHDVYGSQFGVFSGDMVSLFRDSLGEVFGRYDILWVALAIGSAGVLLRPAGQDEREREPRAATPTQSAPFDTFAGTTQPGGTPWAGTS